MTVTGQGVCAHSYRPNSPNLQLTAASIIAQPSHGTLTQTGGLQFRYQPSAGFKGSDRYRIKVCGRSHRGAGSRC